MHGSYDRSKSAPCKSHSEYAVEHYEKVSTFQLGRPCQSCCPFNRKCGMAIPPKRLICAHEHSFGTNTRVETAADGTNVCKAEKINSESMQVLRELAAAAITVSADDTSKTVENLTVDRIGPVCAEYWAAAYGIRHGTANSILAEARKSHLDADKERKEAGIRGHIGFKDDAPSSLAQEKTIEWWTMWLLLEDQMPNEPVIVCRTVTWEAVYDQEYVKDIEWWEYFGVEADGFTPRRLLSTRLRASHSNFGVCPDCEDIKTRRGAFRKESANYTRSEVITMKEELFKHVHEMRKERVAAMAIHRECVGLKEWLFEYDDKCGSHYTFLPSPKGVNFSLLHGRRSFLTFLNMPVSFVFNMHCRMCNFAGGREPHPSKFKYHTALQGNLCPGKVNCLSIVPPCVKTGANIGCTVFFLELSSVLTNLANWALQSTAKMTVAPIMMQSSR
eukprot:6210985-Pleurochrysis_carterae.AAC.2